MKIEWNKVTRFSQEVAIILFVSVYFLGIYLGAQTKEMKILGQKINDVVFQCESNKSIHAVFYKNSVHISLSEGIETFLPQTISASGARYANYDESLVFWNKGKTAFVTQGNINSPTYSNCVIKN